MWVVMVWRTSVHTKGSSTPLASIKATRQQRRCRVLMRAACSRRGRGLEASTAKRDRKLRKARLVGATNALSAHKKALELCVSLIERTQIKTTHGRATLARLHPSFLLSHHPCSLGLPATPPHLSRARARAQESRGGGERRERREDVEA